MEAAQLRRSIEEQTLKSQELQRCITESERREGDDFNSHNFHHTDRYGHLQGDALLIAAEERAKVVDVRQQLEAANLELKAQRDGMQAQGDELRTKSLKVDLRNEMVLKELSAVKMEKRELRKKLDEATEQLISSTERNEASAKKVTPTLLDHTAVCVTRCCPAVCGGGKTSRDGAQGKRRLGVGASVCSNCHWAPFNLALTPMLMCRARILSLEAELHTTKSALEVSGREKDMLSNEAISSSFQPTI